MPRPTKADRARADNAKKARFALEEASAAATEDSTPSDVIPVPHDLSDTGDDEDNFNEGDPDSNPLLWVNGENIVVVGAASDSDMQKKFLTLFTQIRAQSGTAKKRSGRSPYTGESYDTKQNKFNARKAGIVAHGNAPKIGAYFPIVSSNSIFAPELSVLGPGEVPVEFKHAVSRWPDTTRFYSPYVLKIWIRRPAAKAVDATMDLEEKCADDEKQNEANDEDFVPGQQPASVLY